MKIHGYRLPNTLYNLIKNKTLLELPLLSVAVLYPLVPRGVKISGGAYDGLRLYNIDSIKRESQPSHLYKDLGELYAMSSSICSGEQISDLHILDVDMALLIAGNYDEEIIALDYRVDSSTPRILGFFGYWVLLANSFAEFAEKTGLLADAD